MITNNQFSNDTVDVRLLRLQRIEDNIATHTAALGLAPATVTWGAGAFTAMKNARLQTSLALTDMKSKTYLYNQALGEMSAVYQICKTYADLKFDEHKQRIIDMGFDEVYPEDQDKQLERIAHVIAKHALWVSDGLTPLLKPILVTRLQNAFTAASAAKGVRDAAELLLEHK